MIFPESDRLFQKFILMKMCSGTATGVGRKDGVRIHLVHNPRRFRAVCGGSLQRLATQNTNTAEHPWCHDF